MTDSEFVKNYQEIIRKGMADDRYPLLHVNIQLPNGWYAIDSVLTDLSNVLTNKYEYDEMLVPTITTKASYKDVSPELKENIEEKVVKITHTGLNKLEEPFYLSGRPDLIVPQVVKLIARSYRDLPTRRLLRYFRYIDQKYPEEVSLITDIEFQALDAEGIFATEEDYTRELANVQRDFEEFLDAKLHLRTLKVRKGISTVYYVILPNNSVLEVARIYEFGQALSKSIGFTVLESNNKPNEPYIFDLNVTQKIVGAIVATNTEGGRVVLPRHCMRVHGTAYGVELPAMSGVRVECLRKEFTADLHRRRIEEGQYFSIKPCGDGSVTVVLASSEETVALSALESRLTEIAAAEDAKLAARASAEFESRLAHAVQYVAAGAPVPDGFAVLGEKIDEPEKVVVAKTFLPL